MGLRSGHENKTVEWLLSFPATSTSASECDRSAWISAVTPRSQSRDVITSTSSTGKIEDGVGDNEEEKIYEEWDCPQIEVTEEYSPDNQINDPTSDDVTLDMQKGDKANVLKNCQNQVGIMLSGVQTARKD